MGITLIVLFFIVLPVVYIISAFMNKKGSEGVTTRMITTKIILLIVEFGLISLDLSLINFVSMSLFNIGYILFLECVIKIEVEQQRRENENK